MTVVGNYISRIFADSPVNAIQEHCDRCYKASRELVDLFDRVFAGDWDAVDASRERIVRLENEADDLKREVRSQLPHGLFMPIARQDLMELVLLQDKIANLARDISGLVAGRKMVVPQAIQSPLAAFILRNVDAAKKARKTIRELDELYETRFKGSEAELVRALIDELDQIENETDEMQIEIRALLQPLEAKLLAVDAVFLYRVIEMIGGIGDRAEAVGRRLETLLVR
jgi:predicted phosphate transport protein (TIGR00153 family)